MPSPFDLQARIRALLPQSREEQIGDAFDRRRQFLEGMLSERGILDSGLADADILALEQERLNTLSPVGRGGGGGGGGGFDFEPPEAPEAPPPRQTQGRPVTPQAPPTASAQAPPDFITQLRQALRASSQAEGAQRSARGSGQPTDPFRLAGGTSTLAQQDATTVAMAQQAARAQATAMGFSPEALAGLGASSRPMESPQTVFRRELTKRRDDVTKRTPIELAKSIVGAWHEADQTRQQLELLTPDNDPVLQSLAQRSEALIRPTGFTEERDPATGQTIRKADPRLPADPEQIRQFQETQQALAQQVQAQLARLRQQRQELEATRKLREERVQREFKEFEKKFNPLRPLTIALGDTSRESARIALGSKLRAAAEKIRDFAQVRDTHGGLMGWQTIMAAATPQKLLRVAALIDSGATIDQAKKELSAVQAERVQGRLGA